MIDGWIRTIPQTSRILVCFSLSSGAANFLQMLLDAFNLLHLLQSKGQNLSVYSCLASGLCRPLSFFAPHAHAELRTAFGRCSMLVTECHKDLHFWFMDYLADSTSVLNIRACPRLVRLKFSAHENLHKRSLVKVKIQTEKTQNSCDCDHRFG